MKAAGGWYLPGRQRRDARLLLQTPVLQSLLGYLAMDSQRRPLLIQASPVWPSVPAVSQWAGEGASCLGRRGGRGLSDQARVLLPARY